MTPLHWAVQRGYEDSVEVLLRYGADVGLENKFGKTPFDIATGKNRTDIIELLQVRVDRTSSNLPFYIRRKVSLIVAAKTN